MESIRFNTFNIYKGCNVFFFNELTGQNVRNFTKKLCKHLTSSKKTFNICGSLLIRIEPYLYE